MIQLLIALFGLTSLFCSMSNSTRLRKLGPLIGLSGQPFWFMATIPTGQWGMVALCVCYTVVFASGAWMQWRPK